MPYNKKVKKVLKPKKVKEVILSLEEAVKLQTHCAGVNCNNDLNLTGYVENDYKKFCGPGCAS